MGERRASQRSAGEIARLIAVVLAAVALAGSTVLRFVIAGRQPLWLDETWTAAIAAQPDFHAFWRQVWLDVNAPLYYLVMHLWQMVAGLSDAALRLPSAVFGAAAPLIIAATPEEGLERPARLTWAALLGLWIPGLWLSGDARCYALLLLFCTLQTLAFAALLRKPDLPQASLWCGVSCLAILTHYHAAIPTALEGAAYLAVGRTKALRTWPAAFLFAPAVAWIAIHAPRVAAFARPGVAWYPTLRVDHLGALAAYPFGTKDLAWAILAIGAAAFVLALAMGGRGRLERLRPTGALWIAFGCALLGAVLLIGMGFLRPSFTDRYLTPFIPALLLGVALIAQGLSRRVPITYAGVILAAMIAAFAWAQTELKSGWRYYNWEQASTDLMRGQPDRLVFIWDHPASPILNRDQLAAVGGFFFRRAGVPVTVDPVVLDASVDPNPTVVGAAQGDHTALIWAYDRGVVGTAARRFPPMLTELDPGLICRNYGSGSVGVLACDRFGSVKTAHP